MLPWEEIGLELTEVKVPKSSAPTGLVGTKKSGQQQVLPWRTRKTD